MLLRRYPHLRLLRRPNFVCRRPIVFATFARGLRRVLEQLLGTIRDRQTQRVPSACIASRDRSLGRCLLPVG